MTPIACGLDRLLTDPDRFLKGHRRLGLVVNQTSVTADTRHAIRQLTRLSGYELKKIFAPEHGLYGTGQDMEVMADQKEAGRPVISLYGDQVESLKPRVSLLDDLDALIFDIQDVGARYYTFIYTMANCMAVCREAGVKMIVCDRPNPINGRDVEGNRVDAPYTSFVGQYPLANRHGMTAAELAQMFNDHFEIRCDLTTVLMEGWERSMWYDDTGLPWIAPSPNMPTLDTATVYPGLCLLEGTLLSEGRGTTQPFEQFGAPFIDAHALADALDAEALPGVSFRPHYFKPMFQKCAEKECGGVFIHVVDRDRFKPMLTGVAIIKAVQKLYPEEFQWRTERYEYVSDRLAIDLLYGNPQLREQLLPNGTPLHEIEASWQEELDEFLAVRREYLLY